MREADINMYLSSDEYTRGARRSCKLILFAVAIFSSELMAFTFEPTEAEYNSWSRFCQVSYALSGRGRSNALTNNITEAEKQKLWAKRRSYGGPWHYCASKIWLSRARHAKTKQERQFALERAAANANFTFTHVYNNPKFKAQAAIRHARALKELQDYENALKLLRTARQLSPSNPSVYSMTSLVFEDMEKDDEALRVLEEGDKATDGKSAEINYFLGLLHIKLGDIESARKHADVAYELGYPLPGLREKLRSLPSDNEDQ